METKLNNFKEELSQLGMVGKTVKEIIIEHPSLYYKIYRYAKKESLWLPKVFYDLGLKLNRVDGIDSIQKLDSFIKDIFHYDNGEWNNISTAHKVLIKKSIDALDIHFDAFLARYSITNTEVRAYLSIEEIKQDLILKGLENASISEIRAFDGNKTIANIDSFASKNNFKMKDIWFALNISYEKGIVVCDTGVKRDFVYNNEAEMIKDISSKGLIGKTKKDVWNYDNGKTAARVNIYARRCGISMKEVWEKLQVRNSPKVRTNGNCSIVELKTLVEERGLVGKTIKEVKTIDPEIFPKVKKLARSGQSMREIWKAIGIVRGHGFSSIDEIVEKIKAADYKTLKDIRSDWKFYKRVAGFADRNKIDIREIWERAGIVLSNEGRPSKKHM